MRLGYLSCVSVCRSGIPWSRVSVSIYQIYGIRNPPIQRCEWRKYGRMNATRSAMAMSVGLLSLCFQVGVR